MYNKSHFCGLFTTQVPIFIGLYRSLLSLASEKALDEPFLWLPR